LCGPSPAFGLVDGWTLLAAQMQGCASPELQFQRRNGGTGLRSDLIASSLPSLRINSVSNFKERDYCRISGNDLFSWILPVIVMRAEPNFDPFEAFRQIRDMPDTQALLKEVASGKCVAAIESGSLGRYNVQGVANLTNAVNVIATSPELPFGGVVVSNKVPQDLAVRVTKLLSDPTIDALQGLIDADRLLPTSASTFDNMVQLLQTAGMDLTAIAR
jgi:hypothetical protein